MKSLELRKPGNELESKDFSNEPKTKQNWHLRSKMREFRVLTAGRKVLTGVTADLTRELH